MQGTLGAQRHALAVLGVGLAFHDTGDLPELAANLYHDGLGCGLHRAHGHGGEDKGQHGADEQANQHSGAGQGEVQVLHGTVLYNVDIGDQQSQRGQGSGADGKALAGGSGGVAQGVQGVGTVTNFFGQAGHLGNAASVVRHGAVGVGGQGDAQGGEHAHAGDADAVQALVEREAEAAHLIQDGGGAACGEVGDQDGHRHDQDGGDGGHQAQGNAADDDGSGAGLGSGGQLFGGLIVIRGKILGEVADESTADQTAEDGNEDAPAVVLRAENEVAQGGGHDGG